MKRKLRGLPGSRKSDNPWRIERRDNFERAGRKRRIRRAFEKAEKLGVSFDSVYQPEPAKAPDPRQQTIFRYSPTGDRLVIETDGDGCEFEWQGARQELADWARIETTDGKPWIIERPRVAQKAYPRPPQTGLSGERMSTILFNARQQAWTIGASPECATERFSAAAVAQILSALQEACKAGGPRAHSFIESLDTSARSYLGTLSFGTSDTPIVGPYGQGKRTVYSRPAALLRLAGYWFVHLPHQETKDADEREHLSLGERFIDDVRKGSLYAELAKKLPKLATAGKKEARQIAQAYAAAYETVLGVRRSKLCERCAPGRGALGTDGRTYYAQPMPWEAGWGCRSPRDCVRKLESVREAARGEARTVVRRAAGILGMPPIGTRSLFDFERVKEERATGKRPNGIRRARG
jgi:hypothetical protein